MYWTEARNPPLQQGLPKPACLQGTRLENRHLTVKWDNEKILYLDAVFQAWKMMLILFFAHN